MTVHTIIKQNPVASFIALTLGLVLATFLLPVPQDSAFVLIAFMLVIIPALVAFGLAALMDGRRGLSAFRREAFNWHVTLNWVLIAFALGFVLHFGSSILALLTGRTSAIQIAAPTAFFIAYFPLALLEEIGWRGFALRHLLDRQSPLVATLMVGIPWAVLHFALFFFYGVPNTSPIAEMLTVFAWSLPLTWIYVKSGRNVLVATILHGALNGFGFLAASIPPAEVLWFAFAAACIVDAFLVVMDRHIWFAHPDATKTGQAVKAAVRLA